MHLNLLLLLLLVSRGQGNGFSLLRSHLLRSHQFFVFPDAFDLVCSALGFGHVLNFPAD
jgi:hypothetical protein